MPQIYKGQIRPWANTKYRIVDIKLTKSGVVGKVLVEMADPATDLPDNYEHCGVKPNEQTWVEWWRGSHEIEAPKNPD